MSVTVYLPWQCQRSSGLLILPSYICAFLAFELGNLLLRWRSIASYLSILSKLGTALPCFEFVPGLSDMRCIVVD